MRCASWLAVIFLATAAVARAATINVPADYTTIQGGVDAASVGDTVFVASGTFDDLHYPPGADTTQCVVYMKSGITLLGSGQGQTTIDALDAGRGIHCYGVTNAHIEGFTVINAFAEVFAAGIFCTEGSSPTITGCEITSCGDGGIICSYSSDPDISYCEITNNESKQGGGIAVEHNSAPNVTYCTITGNSAPVAGGVYVKAGSAPVFENCVIDDNFLNTISGKGGGVAATNSQITLRNCTVNDNVSSGAGGGIHLEDAATAILESTSIQNNSTPAGAYGPGGGIYCELSDMDLDGCTITGNSAPDASSDGGGIFIFFTTVTTIRGCTIAGNGTTSNPNGLGAGISCFAFASPVIENTILAFNGPGRGLYCADGTSTPIVICSDIYGNEDGDAICGVDSTGNFSADPLFCDMAMDDYTLSPTSPCLPGQHPNGAPCGQIGAHGVGTCDPSGVDLMSETFLQRLVVSPNPLRSSGTFHFGMVRPDNVSLAIYDVSGRRVRLLMDNRILGAGDHEISWNAQDDDGRDVTSGVYFCRLRGSVSHQTGRLVLRR
jgi:parallel beta-helix repeat protein